jgi:hypothetical protein
MLILLAIAICIAVAAAAVPHGTSSQEEAERPEQPYDEFAAYYADVCARAGLEWNRDESITDPHAHQQEDGK